MLIILIFLQERKIKSMGGDDAKKEINNIMAVIMTDELAMQCTWVIHKLNKLKLINFYFPNFIAGKLCF